MKNALNGKIKVWQMLFIVLTLMLFTGATIALADTNAVSSLFPQGTVLLGSSSANGNTTITTPTDGSALEALSVSFDIPTGKKGDVQATFTGFLQHNSGTYSFCFGEFRFDSPTGTPLNPNTISKYQLLGGSISKLPDQITSTFTGFRKGLKPGHYVLKAYLSSSYATCNVHERNMNVIVNLH